MRQRPKRMRLAVLGAGSWGTALAQLCAEQGYHVGLWGRTPQVVQAMRQERENRAYLPGMRLHANIDPTTDFSAAVDDIAMCFSVVPSHAVRAVWNVVAPLLPPRTVVVSATKGIEATSLLTMSQVIQATIPQQADIAVLSGPTFAHEVSQQTPTAAVLAAANRHVAERVQGVVSTTVFRVYTSTDVLGVELGGALKNVMAIAAGVCDGLQLGFNTRAALIARALSEISQLGVAMGARAHTFAGLSGLGDLVLTCTGPRSRNYTVGVQLGQGKKLAEILQSMHMVAEGVTTTQSAVALGERYGVEMPIATQVQALLQGHITPYAALTELLTRALKHEDH